MNDAFTLIPNCNCSHSFHPFLSGDFPPVTKVAPELNVDKGVKSEDFLFCCSCGHWNGSSSSWSRFPNQTREPSFVLCSNWIIIVAQQSFIQVKFIGGVFRLTFSTEVCVFTGYLFDPVCVVSACCCMQTKHP